jgi:hypothetical protein
MTEQPPQPRHDDDDGAELHGSPPDSQHARDDGHDVHKGKEPAVQAPSEATAGDKLKSSRPNDDEHGSDGEEDEEGGEEDEDEDDEEDDEEDEEPLLKYARLTQHLSAVYRNGDATSAFLVAGDKMVCYTPPSVPVYACVDSDLL